MSTELQGASDPLAVGCANQKSGPNQIRPLEPGWHVIQCTRMCHPQFDRSQVRPHLSGSHKPELAMVLANLRKDERE